MIKKGCGGWCEKSKIIDGWKNDGVCIVYDNVILVFFDDWAWLYIYLNK